MPAALIGLGGTLLGGAVGGTAGALIAGAAPLVGSLVSGNKGAKGASQTQANAANQSSQTFMNMYNQTRSDLAPYMTTGTDALSQIAKLWGLGPGGSGQPDGAAMTSALESFPGYQFGRQQGSAALDRSAGSHGMLLSGAQLQDSQKFGTDYAMQQGWQPYISMLSGLSSLGQNSAAAAGGFGADAAKGIASGQLAAGQATANGQQAQANNTSSLIGQAGQLLGTNGGGLFGGGQSGLGVTPANYGAGFAAAGGFNNSPINISGLSGLY